MQVRHRAVSKARVLEAVLDRAVRANPGGGVWVVTGSGHHAPAGLAAPSAAARRSTGAGTTAAAGDGAGDYLAPAPTSLFTGM